MLRTRSSVGIGALLTAFLTLSASAADANVLDVYGELAEQGASPAPLVPTTVPRVLRPVERRLENGSGGNRREYSLRWYRPGAVLLVRGGEYRTMSALLRVEQQRYSYRAKRTRVRGRPGYLLTRKLGPDSYKLAWVERGVVQTIATGTARKVSVADLRRTAAGLERLGGSYLGSSADPQSGAGASAVTTEHTVTLRVDFEASCTTPGSPEPSIRAGSAEVVLLPHKGDSFTFDIARHRSRRSGPWEGTVSGTVSPSAITLDVRPSGTIDGMSCSGAETLRLERR